MLSPIRLIFRTNRNRITTPNYQNVRALKTSSVCCTFWERDEKGGYNTKHTPKPFKERMRVGLQELKSEIALWKEEVREGFESDPILAFRPGETDVVWRFGNEDSLKRWVVTSDSDHGEGYSKCSLDLTNTGKGIFCGELCTRVPKDGRIKRAGYCNMKSIRPRKSFQRDSYHEWSPYNMLVMKVRGDGRAYLLNVATKGYYDLMWNDVYHYVLFTRGGPYWQVSRIPFSKFFLSSKGRVQDKQSPIPLSRVTSFGISAGDKIDGPFSLEIDYIGLEYDPNHTETFAYEMYQTPNYIVAT